MKNELKLRAYVRFGLEHLKNFSGQISELNQCHVSFTIETFLGSQIGSTYY